MTPALAPRERIGEPSPPEAWTAPAPVPDFRREFFRWIGHIRSMHRDTVLLNPIYRRTARVGYGRPPLWKRVFRHELVVGMVGSAATLLAIAVLARLDDRAIPRDLPLHFFSVMGAIFMITLLLQGLFLPFRAGRFIKTMDKAPGWEQLLLTPVRELDFLWAWIWSPILRMYRYIYYALVFGTFGIIFFPIRYWGFTHRMVDYSPIRVLIGLPSAIILLSVSGMIVSACLTMMLVGKALNIGGRIYDFIEIFWEIFLGLPLVVALVCQVYAFISLIAAVTVSPRHLFDSCIASLGAIVFGLVAAWMEHQYLIASFWSSIQARRFVRYQKSWIQSLFGR